MSVLQSGKTTYQQLICSLYKMNGSLLAWRCWFKSISTRTEALRSHLGPEPESPRFQEDHSNQRINWQKGTCSSGRVARRTHSSCLSHKIYVMYRFHVVPAFWRFNFRASNRLFCTYFCIKHNVNKTNYNFGECSVMLVNCVVLLCE